MRGRFLLNYTRMLHLCMFTLLFHVFFIILSLYFGRHCHPFTGSRNVSYQFRILVVEQWETLLLRWRRPFPRWPPLSSATNIFSFYDQEIHYEKRPWSMYSRVCTYDYLCSPFQKFQHLTRKETRIKKLSQGFIFSSRIQCPSGVTLLLH